MPMSEDQIAAILDAGRRGESAAQIARSYGDGPSADELARQQRHEALHSSSTAPGQEPPADPIADMVATYRSALSGGVPPDRAEVEAFDVLFRAAAAGDERVVARSTHDTETFRRWQDDSRRRQANAHESQHRS